MMQHRGSDPLEYGLQLQRQTDRLQTLNEIGRVMASTLELQTLYETIYQQIGRVMDASQFFLALQRPEDGRIEVPYLREDGTLLRDQLLPAGEHMTGTIIRTGTDLLFHTSAEYDRRRQAFGLGGGLVGRQDSESGIFVPLHTGSRTIGALTVQSPRAYAYSTEDLQLLRVLAAQAAIAIENARLYAAQQRRVDELQTIQSIVEKLTPLHEAREVVEVIGAELSRLIDYNICGVFELDEDRNVLVPILFQGAEFPFSHVGLGEGLTGWVGLHGCSALVHDTCTDERVAMIPGSPDRPESLIAAPMLCEGRVRGVITLSQLGREQFDANALRLLEIIAAQTAIAFDRARLYAELRSAALTDPLTRLDNRRALLDRLSAAQSRAQRTGEPLWVFMLDLDRFKRVNDRWGHAVGDAVLLALARVVQRVLRAEDRLARYGGEEFCLVVSGLAASAAGQLAERIRQVVAQEVRVPVRREREQLTVSVGVAAWHAEEAVEALLTRADAAMYAAKAAGGNAVAFAPGDERLEEPKLISLIG